MCFGLVWRMNLDKIIQKTNTHTHTNTQLSKNRKKETSIRVTTINICLCSNRAREGGQNNVQGAHYMYRDVEYNADCEEIKMFL